MMVYQDSFILSTSRSRPREVLIVEDEQSSRRALSLLLCRCGFRPQTFGTAEEALIWLRGGGHPQVAVVDLDLPGMDGVELIEKLALISPTTRSVLVTATDEDTLARRTRWHDVNYLRKPIDFESLLSLLDDQ